MRRLRFLPLLGLLFTAGAVSPPHGSFTLTAGQTQCLGALLPSYLVPRHVWLQNSSTIIVYRGPASDVSASNGFQMLPFDTYEEDFSTTSPVLLPDTCVYSPSAISSPSYIAWEARPE